MHRSPAPGQVGIDRLTHSSPNAADANSGIAPEQPSLNGWWLVLGLSIGTAVSNGFARFAYGLILPAMRTDLQWTFTEAGWINTANAIGYLVGALAALALIRRWGAAVLFVTGMVMIAVALLASGMTADFRALSFWRLVAGIGGAPVFVAAGALASGLFQHDPRRNALAIAFCLAGGGGMGMLLAGVAIPWLLEVWGGSSWPLTWLALGATSALLTPLCWLAIRAMPETGAVPGGLSGRLALAPVLPALAGYFMFGLGYIIYMTFLVAWMRETGADAGLIAGTWAILSAMVIASPFIWQRVLAWSRGGGAMAAASVVTGIAILLPVTVNGEVPLIISAALFGGAFFIVPTAATSFSRKHFGRPQWGAAMAWFTVAFATGQTIGPVAAGALADQAGNVAAGLWLGGAVMLAGGAISLLQRPAR